MVTATRPTEKNPLPAKIVHANNIIRKLLKMLLTRLIIAAQHTFNSKILYSRVIDSRQILNMLRKSVGIGRMSLIYSQNNYSIKREWAINVHSSQKQNQNTFTK